MKIQNTFKLTNILLDILRQDYMFPIIFGDKRKVDDDADCKVVLIPVEDKKEKIKKWQQNSTNITITKNDIEGFLLYNLDTTTDIKEFKCFSLKKHKGYGSSQVFDNLYKNKLHVLANAPIIEPFMGMGVTVDHIYDNYLGETMAVLDFNLNY